MFEIILCSLITVLPDYLFRKYRQGKTWGKEINFFSVWYELRWGISSCFLLALGLFTLIFYYHPSTTNATPMYRAIPILPETNGRVEHVFVGNHQKVKAGEPLFSMFDESQLAAIEQAKAQVNQIESELITAEAQRDVAKSNVDQAENSYLRAKNEYDRKKLLASRGKNIISESEVQRLADTVAMKEASVSAAEANKEAAEAMITDVLPARRATAIAALENAKVTQSKRTVYASVDGELQQFVLQPGDIVNPFIRSAGVIVPTAGFGSGRQAVYAGFNQLAGNVIKEGTFAEITCLSKPFTVIPMKVASVQSVISTGQMSAGENLIDLQERAKPGSIAVRLEPLYEGGLDGVIPGTKCVANAYSYHHELLNSGELSTSKSLYLHMVDTVGLIHAIILRMQALILPVKVLVFSGH